MKRTLLMTVAFAFISHMAAALTADELAASFTADGYGFIQIKTGTTQIKVQAIKDGLKVETIYDAATGTILKTETHEIGTVSSVDPGVRQREVTRDFVQIAEDGTVVEGGHRRGGRGPRGDEAAPLPEGTAPEAAPAATPAEEGQGRRGRRGRG